MSYFVRKTATMHEQNITFSNIEGKVAGIGLDSCL